jgi:hypothetical protein
LRITAATVIVSAAFSLRAEQEAVPAARAIEVDVSAAYSFLVSSRDSNGTALSRRNGGPGAAVSVSFRSPYFLSPFLDLSFHPLYASTDLFDLDAALGGPTVQRSSLLAFGLIAGAAFDYSLLRLRAGIGLSDVLLRSRSGALRASEWDMTYFLSASGFVLKWGRVKFGLESRVGFIADARLSFVTIGLVAGGDAVRWGGTD